MASKTAIANLALIRLGADASINNIDADSGTRAAQVRAVFEPLRDALLRTHPWNFAMDLAILAADATAPVAGYTYAYTLPQSPYCLRVVRLHRDHHLRDARWKTYGRKIHTDEGAPLYIEFIKQVTDTEQFDAIFVEALALKIAAKIAFAVTGKEAVARDCEAEYRALLGEARFADAVDSGVTEPYDDDSDFLDARFHH